jgi:two-component system, LytTR family, response regulator
MIKAIIIDDASKAIKSLQLRIERLFDDIEIVATAQSANDGKAVIDQHKPDLVFLDIEMPNGNAFALLKQFDSIDFAIILLRPTMNMLCRPSGSVPWIISNSQSIRIALPTMGGIEYVHINQIVYCEADNNYSTIHLEGMPSILISKTLKFFEDVLKDFYFMRIHQSYLINLFKVVRFEKSNRGRVVLNNGATINLSKNKKEEFLEKISKLTRI